jgi:Fe-S-cluster containining protein
MKGTLRGLIRCVALEGEIGKSVRCRVYANRPSTCREFAVSWEEGKHHELCDRARMAHGLPPLAPPESDGPPILPRAA